MNIGNSGNAQWEHQKRKTGPAMNAAPFFRLKSMVPVERLELSRCYHRGILNPLRLPFRHTGQWRVVYRCLEVASTG